MQVSLNDSFLASARGFLSIKHSMASPVKPKLRARKKLDRTNKDRGVRVRERNKQRGGGYIVLFWPGKHHKLSDVSGKNRSGWVAIGFPALLNCILV